MIEYGRRTRSLPAPPDVVWEDLVAPSTTGPRTWLDLLPDEVGPRTVDSTRPSRVVWSSLWPDRPGDQLHLEIADDGCGGSTVTFTLLAAGDPPDSSKTGHIRKRVNQLLWADLRYSYGN